MKLLVIGHGRHGKDTVCEILQEKYDLSFESSSRFCSKHFIFDLLKDKYNYKDEYDCYNDRFNHRTEWYNAIREYNKDDDSRLGREILKRYNIYSGLRNKNEFFALKKNKVFDYAIWVDRCNYLPFESIESMNLEQWMADFVIDNNGSLDDLKSNVNKLMDQLKSTRHLIY
jgi:hypothetical protein